MIKTSKTGIAMVAAMVGSLVLTVGSAFAGGKETEQVISVPMTSSARECKSVKTKPMSYAEHIRLLQKKRAGNVASNPEPRMWSYGSLTLGDYAYRTNAAGQATITWFNKDYSGALVITNTLGGCPVTDIGVRAFRKCTNLTDVVIPGSVVRIGDSAFGDSFSGCTSLTNVTIPASVSRTGNRAFFGCTSLVSVTISSGVTRIDDSSFYGCSRLANVVIPNSVTNIGGCAFQDCASLTNVMIPASVAIVGPQAFFNCSSLTAIDVDAANPKYSSVDGVLYDKNQTTLIACPCGKAGRVVIPNGVTSKGPQALVDCSKLTSIWISGSVTGLARCISSSLKDYGFYQCSGLTAIDVDAANPEYSSVGGVLFDKSKSTLIACPPGKEGGYTIPSGVAAIAWGAFSGCISLTDITIPASVTCIGFEAFEYCTSLTNITIPASVTNIDRCAFKNCTSLTKVAIPDNVASIKHEAFYGCSSLANVVIPNSVTCIESEAFCGCTSLTNITIPAGVTNIEYNAFHNCTNLPASIREHKSVKPKPMSYLERLRLRQAQAREAEQVISAPVTSSAPRVCPEFLTLGDYEYRTNAAGQATIKDFKSRYAGALSITNALDGYPVTAIESWGFGNCSNLTSVTIPASVTNVEPKALTGCSSLMAIMVDAGSPAYSSADGVLFNKNQTTLVKFPGGRVGHYTTPASVTSIGDQAFKACSHLAGVVIPASVTSIGGDALEECSSLKAIKVAKGNSAYTSVDGVLFDKAMTTLIRFPGGKGGHYAVSSNVAVIEDSAFSFCRGLDSVTIPGSVTNIRRAAFWECTGLTNITIPKGINIEDDAFEKCTNLPASIRTLAPRSVDKHGRSQCLSMPPVPIPVPKYTGAEAQKHLEQYQKELIRAGGEKGPPLPMPVTPEMDAQLVKEGVLPPLENKGGQSETSNPMQKVAPDKAKLVLKFNGAPSDMLLDDYSARKGLTLLLSPGLPVSKITLLGEYLSLDDYCDAIEAKLKDKGIRIVRVGGPFAKVVPWTDDLKVNGLDQLVPATVMTDGTAKAFKLRFNHAPVEMLLQDYADKAGMPMFVSRDLPRVNIILRSQGDLTQQEYFQAIDNVLLLHGIKLILLDGRRLGAIPAMLPESKRTEAISALMPLKFENNK